MFYLRVNIHSAQSVLGSVACEGEGMNSNAGVWDKSHRTEGGHGESLVLPTAHL